MSATNDSRRDFLKTTAAAGAAAAVLSQVSTKAFAEGEEKKLRVALIGCGGRGSGALSDCVAAGKQSGTAIEVVALADAFEDTVKGAFGRIKGWGENKVKPENIFHGTDAYKKVCALPEVDLVLCATPPYFRPFHLAEAIKNGKHAFIEKPVAVDPHGIRIVIAAAEEAEKKKLSIVCGTQRRHERCYIEGVKMIQDGVIGDVINVHGYWNMGGLWTKGRQPGQGDTEHQMRNWLYHTWLSGDHIVEQHVHQLDVMNWVMGAAPVKAMGVGGRQTRTAEIFGHINDHFGLEFEYPGFRRCLSMARQQNNCSNRVQEYVQGTKGHAIMSSGRVVLRDWQGKVLHNIDNKGENPYVQEHVALQKSIKGAVPYLNEGRRIAESTLTAILGREAVYTGQDVTFDFMMKESKLKLGPAAGADLDLKAALAVAPVAMPGQTKLV